MCFIFHKFGKWIDTENRGMLNYAFQGSVIKKNVGSWQEQKRVCEKCGISQLRTVRNLF